MIESKKMGSYLRWIGSLGLCLAAVASCQHSSLTKMNTQAEIASLEDNQLRQTAKTSTHKHSLSGQWAFKTDPYKKGEALGWQNANLDTMTWDMMDVPGVWDVVDEYHDYTGDAWYRTSFKFDPAWSDKRVRLAFDSVYHDSEVWLNGEKLGENNLGFIPFSFEIDEFLERENSLVVKVNNRVKRGAVWNWGGIRRPVYLEITPRTHIERVHVFADPDLDTGSATLNVKTTISSSEIREDFAVKLSVLRDGEVIAEQVAEGTHTIDAGGELEVATSINLPSDLVELWHFNDPNLYNIEAKIIQNDDDVHVLTDRFGIRKVEVKGDQFYLNGEAVRLVGFNMVPEDRFDGNALPLSRIKEDVDLLKSMNANFARLSGPNLPKEYLDYLDEVGFLLVEEVGLWGKDRMVDPNHPTPKVWLEKMVEARYNHPSIVAWSVGNEIGDLNKNPLANEYVQTAIAHAKELDPSRLGVYISYSADFQENDPAQFSDIIMFNKYSDHEERLKVVRSYHPDKPIFFSEIGTKLDSEDPNLSEMDPEEMMGDLRKYPYLIGTSFFAFSDYRSNWKDSKPTWTTPQSENRSWGVLTAYREPKRGFHKIQKFYAPVQALRVEDSVGKLNVSVEPRGKNTFPAHVMREYSLVWQARAADGSLIDAGIQKLPPIFPGDDAFKLSFDLPSQYASAIVSLIDPMGYEVLYDRVDQIVPESPVIRAIHSSIDTIRVVFNKSENAIEHELTLTDEAGNVFTSGLTINEFAEITGLNPYTHYKLELVGVNQAGRSAPAKVIEATVSTDNDELPPVVWDISGKIDAFHIGYSSERNDFRYEIKYGLASEEYTQTNLIETHGATRIPAIEIGKPHYFKLRRLVTGRVDSEWTDEYRVELLGSDGILPPKNASLINADGEAVLLMEPVDRATGYKVVTYSDLGREVFDVNIAQSKFAIVEGIDLSTVLRAEIHSKDEFGNAGEAAALELLR
ncbi:glycoside hydrolase family 2 TIM barrel-domain containing protein [Hirschia litorea]|uniref:Glycoside hydrolase family 2 TIM barrel-domain containing protein n=1 Tax=Hirschia litorea TaxID=1199156 RepID=A0ABW2IPS5_9PROT